ncbi:FIST C-terminal domain-containing protein [Chondromyces apiculatus]|nr:FIST C-terminal domain-containing protein [Chondromyces apiculatus]
MTGRSFSAVCGLDTLRPRLAEVRRSARSPAGGLLFLSGALTQQLPAVTELVRDVWKGIPTCVVPAAGVLSERGEIESEAAASGLLWEGGRSLAFAAQPGALGAAVAEVLAPASPPSAAGAVGARGGPRAGTMLVFARPDALGAEHLGALVAAAPGSCIFGAGTVGASPRAISAAGEILEAPVAGLALMGLSLPLLEACGGCRLLSAFHSIDEVTDGGLVLSAGGKPALELLSSCTAHIRRRGTPDPAEPAPVVLAALADPGTESDEAPRYVVRPVRGIDPSRRALLIGDAARPGVRLAFAVRDAAAARTELAAAAQRAARGTLGAAPRFALYLSCAGRGQNLHGAPDVEARILKQRFGDLPIAGMHSAFEIIPWAGGDDIRIALYTGVLALFRAPS